MTKIATVLTTPVVARVDGIDDPTKLALSDAMSYIVEGYEHTEAAARGWDGRSTLYDWTSGKFPAGFVPTALAILHQRGYTPQIKRNPLPAPLGQLPTPDAPLVDDFGRDDNRAYQFKAVSILEKHGSFIARVATGGGKSRIAALCIKRIGRKTIFVTTRQVLLYQMGRALEAAGFKVSYCGDGSWDTSGDVVCAMVQTLSDRIVEYKPNIVKMSADEIKIGADRHERRRAECLEFLDECEFVIAEEAHEAGGNSYYEVCKALKRAHYRLALTATPLMRDGEANARLVGMFGPIRLEVSEEYLISVGILATPKFKFIPIGPKQQPPTLRRGTSWQKAEELGIVTNHYRNKCGVAEIIRAARWGLPAVALVKRKKHGKILHEMLKQYGLRGAYIFGDSDTEARDDALNRLKSGQYDYVIGSTILDVGVDVPSIGVLVLMGGGKAEVAIRQRIGRGLRGKKPPMPNFAFVVDFEDGQSKHLIAHSKQRRAIVEQTPGFKEGILPAGKDFDLAGLGFRPPVKAAA
jgi:superfamily II DNA or RNA helicase